MRISDWSSDVCSSDLMRSSNPVLRDKTFSGQHAEGEVMTMDGMVGKTGILFVLLLIAAGWTWTRFYDVLAEAGPQAAMGAVSPFIWGGQIGRASCRERVCQYV